jgi:hypothetical protein
VELRATFGGAAGHWWSCGPPSGPTISIVRSHNLNQFHQFKTIPNKNIERFDRRQSTSVCRQLCCLFVLVILHLTLFIAQEQNIFKLIVSKRKVGLKEGT